MPENVPCKWCGMEMPTDAEKCPWCYRAPPPPTPPPTPPPAADDGLTEPVIGQEEFGSLASFKALARYDPAMFAVIVLIALSCILSLVSGDWLGFIITAVVLWGILQWTWWAFWIVIIGEMSNIALEAMALLALGPGWSSLHALLGVSLAIDAFVFIVVVARRDRFD